MDGGRYAFETRAARHCRVPCRTPGPDAGPGDPKRWLDAWMAAAAPSKPVHRPPDKAGRTHPGC